MKVLQCTNLIGDSLYLLGPVMKYLQIYPGEVACIVVQDSLAGMMFVRTFSHVVPVIFSEDEARASYPDAELISLNAGKSGEICYASARNGRHWHISEGYAQLLGIDIEGKIEPPTDWHYYPGQFFEQDRKIAIISPFSKSCARHGGLRPNKTLDDWKWEPIIRFLRRHKYLVKITGAPTDRLTKCSIPESDYSSTTTLESLEKELRSASLVISIDNGIGHMASSFGVKTISLWPAIVTIEFIAPIWSPNTTIVQIGDPNLAAPAALLVGIRKMIAYLELGKKP